jgi:hypothetical protein
MSSQALVPYGFVFEYARKYDKEWIKMLKYLKMLFLKHYPFYRKISIEICPIILPSESVFECMLYMDYSDLLATACVCKLWNSLASDELLWSNLLAKTFGLSVTSLKRCQQRKTSLDDPIINSKSVFKIMLQGFMRITSKNQSFTSPPAIPRTFLAI